MINHTLFPHDGDEDIDVGFIHVTRFEDGGTVWAPKQFRAEEIKDLEDVRQLFGGGKYEFIARDTQNRKVVCRSTFKIPGPPKPLAEYEEPEPKVTTPVVTAPPPQTSDMAIMMPILIQMMQMMQQSNTQIITAMMSKAGDTSKDYVTTMQSLHDRHSQAQTQMFQTMLSMKQPGAGGSPGDFMKGVEFMKSFIEKNVPADAQQDESFMATLAQIMQGAQMFMGAPGGSGIPAGMTPDMIAAMFGGGKPEGSDDAESK